MSSHDELHDLEAAVCLATRARATPGRCSSRTSPSSEQLPAVGEIVYARPFATFENHYPVWVDGTQRWYAECAVEACSHLRAVPRRQRSSSGPSVARPSSPSSSSDAMGCCWTTRPGRYASTSDIRCVTSPPDIVGWCDYNSFFASEYAARQWAHAHPDVKGITRSPESMARMVTEVLGDRQARVHLPAARAAPEGAAQHGSLRLHPPHSHRAPRSRPVPAADSRNGARMEAARVEELLPILVAVSIQMPPDRIGALRAERAELLRFCHRAQP